MLDIDLIAAEMYGTTSKGPAGKLVLLAIRISFPKTVVPTCHIFVCHALRKRLFRT